MPRPIQFDRLVEPFTGSGAVFFGLRPKRALLSDLNPELINLFSIMRSHPNELKNLLQRHQEKHCKQHYYAVRERDYQRPLWRAARMLYLNRTCWNGLYRVNKSGRFNVPIGTKSAVVMESDDFSVFAEALENAELKCQDFEATISVCGDGDFLFVDPPYTVKHNFNGFLKYNENMFSWDDQIRLAECLRAAAGRGASIVVTNADHESVRELYDVGFAYRTIARKSVLAGSAAHRGETSEALFTANLRAPVIGDAF
ncbi:MAG: Dam family site-specific DNA-(adenine-N6)-methyltransferase [Sphingomonas bacterium]|nr:Dam family site-specific DNA-(adenine-N6)-methyltransferase [Sphingomonas bacterium]